MRISDTYNFEEHRQGLEKLMGVLAIFLDEYGDNVQERGNVPSYNWTMLVQDEISV